MKKKGIKHVSLKQRLEKQGERKSTLSENDETYLDHIITAIILYYTDDKGKENPWRNELLRWVNSIKERLGGEK